MKALKLLLVVTAIGALVACSSDSSSGTATQYASNDVCTNTSDTQVACDETIASNSGTQVKSSVSSITNAAQVPDSTILPASVTNSQVAAKAAQVKAEAQRINSDPESATDASAFLGTASAGSSVSLNTASYDSTPVAQAAAVQRAPSSAAAVSGSIESDSSSAGGDSASVQAVR